MKIRGFFFDIFIFGQVVNGLVKNVELVKEPTMTDYYCSGVMNEVYQTNSITRCAVKCGSSETCLSFFYNLISQECTLSSQVYASISGCSYLHGTVYYRPEFVTIYNRTCITDFACTMANMFCNQNRCGCSIGYVYNSNTGQCDTSCSSYGTEYVLYPNTEFDVPYTDETVSSLNDCMLKCSVSSTCRGFTYADVPLYGPACRTKNDSPLDRLNKVSFHLVVHYYLRQCA